VDCGACVAICPTGALAALRPTDRALSDQIQAAAGSGGNVVFACAKVAEAEPGLLPVSCLARLDASFVLTAFAAGATDVTLRSGACETCPVRLDDAHVAGAATDAARIMDALPFGGRVIREQREGKAGGGSALTVVETGVEQAPAAMNRLASTPVTRRGFFAVLRHGGTYAAANATGVLKADADPVIDEGPRRELLVRLPRKRERLLASLRELVPHEVPDAVGLFRAPVIDGDRCDRCGMCGRLCPTGALTLEEDSDAGFVRIAGRPDACVACGLCAEVCGPQAIALESVPAGRALWAGSLPVTLVERAPAESAVNDGDFASAVGASFEDKMRALLGVPVNRS
jgi:ferredoxin